MKQRVRLYQSNLSHLNEVSHLQRKVVGVHSPSIVSRYQLSGSGRDTYIHFPSAATPKSTMPGSMKDCGHPYFSRSPQLQRRSRSLGRLRVWQESCASGFGVNTRSPDEVAQRRKLDNRIRSHRAAIRTLEELLHQSPVGKHRAKRARVLI